MTDSHEKKTQTSHKQAATQEPAGLRQRVYALVSSGGEGTANRVFGACISVLILISVTIIVVNTCDIPRELFMVNLIVQSIISIIFTVEYLVRLWVSDLARPDMGKAKARLRFVFSPASLVDLLSFLPFWLFLFVPFDLRFLAAFRVLRIMRILRISFYSKALGVVGSVLKSCAKQLVATLLLLLLLMLVASVLMYNVEHAVQPEAFDNALSGYWWALQTITTIGYGDLYPITFLGRLLGIIIALLGVGMVAIPTGIISAAFVAWSKSQNSEDS